MHRGASEIVPVQLKCRLLLCGRAVVAMRTGGCTTVHPYRGGVNLVMQKQKFVKEG